MSRSFKLCNIFQLTSFELYIFKQDLVILVEFYVHYNI